MRSLTEEETRVLFEKLTAYIGRNISYLIDRKDEAYCFRVQHNKVYYVSKKLAGLATSVSRDHLVSLGVCLGKITKTGKFRLHVTALSVIAPFAKYKVFVKQNGEMPFLYGNHVLKAHVGRISEDVLEHSGIIVFSMDEKPLGFGTTARGAAEIQKLDPTGIVVFHQADVGEYLRDEDTLF